MLTKEQYISLLSTMKDEDWKIIRERMEEKIPGIKGWNETVFRAYSERIVNAGFKNESLN
jgi:hypothetical protein